MVKFSLSKDDLREVLVYSNAGIYVIFNKANDRRYVGSSLNINRRVKKHLNKLRKGDHDNSYLQRSFDKYGESNHEIHIVEECDPELLTKMECKWISEYKSINRKFGFNLTEDPMHPGRLCDEAREKISKAKKGESHHFWGKSLSDDHKILVSESLIGNKRALGSSHSSKTKKIISEKSKAFHDSLSDDRRQEISVSLSKSSRRSKSERHKPTKNNPYPGIYSRNGGESYNAQISVMGKAKWLGTFKDKEEARNAYQKELDKAVKTETQG